MRPAEEPNSKQGLRGRRCFNHRGQCTERTPAICVQRYTSNRGAGIEDVSSDTCDERHPYSPVPALLYMLEPWSDALIRP
ncbi:hypothetical protein AMEX_G14453 [Astyanax mexicanus]|uniref:Uncharacterized protein n=1 Tax=Astyanax mexicanus TaxID=7994 RepID=A0A8T2LNN0_ASTMX|nr:hypothetical protein AMEX_G14453 [Astyanax mexicanus]